MTRSQKLAIDIAAFLVAVLLMSLSREVERYFGLGGFVVSAGRTFVILGGLFWVWSETRRRWRGSLIHEQALRPAPEEERGDALKRTRAYAVVGVLAIFALGSAAFYWYEYRPGGVRGECEQEATQRAVELLRRRAEFDVRLKPGAEKGWFLQVDKEAAYVSCMRMHGIQP